MVALGPAGVGGGGGRLVSFPLKRWIISSPENGTWSGTLQLGRLEPSV